MLRRTRFYLYLTCLLVLATGVTLWYQGWGAGSGGFDPLRFVRRPANNQTRDDAELLGGWIDSLNDGWSIGKNHQFVKRAFQPLMTDARRSTCRILDQKRQVAMGVVVDAQGYILTKASQVLDHKSLRCEFWDDHQQPARLINHLARHDLAMLKVDGPALVPIRWYAGKLPAVGSLLATASTTPEPLSIGVVSMEAREVESDAVLGVILSDSTDRAVVRHVFAGSAAAAAGLEPGDQIHSIDLQSVEQRQQLISLVQKSLPGQTIRLGVSRDGQTLELDVTLGRRADLDVENIDFQGFLGGKLSERRSGFPSVLQHDGLLLPEHCGGPVVDLEGRVIGVNIARAERIASYVLPASVIVTWLDQLKSEKKPDP